MELCSKCNQLKDVTAFSKRAASPNGLQDACKVCKSLANKDYREENRNKELARHKDYRESNRDRELARHKAYRTANLEQEKERYKLWASENTKKIIANNARRKAAKARRTPVWADLPAIKSFYENCPAGQHVDHRVPLRGATVSGLHVLSNLQYLSAEENISKSNKFESSSMKDAM